MDEVNTGFSEQKSGFTEPPINFIKECLTYIPLLITFAYGLGTFNLLGYYWLFGFDITPFLDFGEITNYVLSNLIYLITISIILLIFVYLSNRLISLIFRPVRDSNNILKRYEFRGKFGIILFLLVYALIIVFTIISIFILVKAIRSDFMQPSFASFLFASFTLLIISLGYLIWLKSNNAKLKRYKYLFNLTYLAIFSFIATFDTIVYKVQNIRKYNTNYGNYIVTQIDTTQKPVIVKSDFNYFYIGKTSKYVFFYNNKKNIVDVYPEVVVKKYSIH